MQFLIALVLAAVAIPQSSSLQMRASAVLVRTVIDGDTIDVADVGRVRLLGIDAPEIGRGVATPAPFDRKRAPADRSPCCIAGSASEQDNEKFDAYNRHLAYLITEDGQFVNAILVREGLARVSGPAADHGAWTN